MQKGTFIDFFFFASSLICLNKTTMKMDLF